MSDYEEGLKLSDGEPGKRYKIRQIPEEKAYRSRLLPLGILPETEIELSEKSKVGALIIEKGNDMLAISYEVASKIEVEPVFKGRRKRRYRHGAE